MPIWIDITGVPNAILLACIPALTLAADRLLGEPRVRWHPVVWMGYYLIHAGALLAPRVGDPRVRSNAQVFSVGALTWCLGAAVVFALAWAVQAWVLTLPAWLAALVLALLLKPMMSWAMLHDEVLAVEGALGVSLATGQAQLARLVSRDVSQLSHLEVRESALESLAENLNDSVVAPLFWFALLGLPGAVLFRFANTADSMWGYMGAHPLGGVMRDWRWAGKWAARADDVLAYVPARITAALIWLVGGLRGAAAMSTEASRTPSPNSGWPMAAMALALGVRLRKPGAYALNGMGRAAELVDTVRACALASRSVLAATLLCCALLMWMLTAGS